MKFSSEVHVLMRIQTNKKLIKILHTPVCDVASQSSFALSFDLIGQQQNKRFYVTEIAGFRVERRDERRQVLVRTLAIAESQSDIFPLRCR